MGFDGRGDYSYTFSYWTKKYVFVNYFSNEMTSYFQTLKLITKHFLKFFPKSEFVTHMTSLTVFRTNSYDELKCFDQGSKFGDYKLKKALNTVKKKKK